MKNFDEIENELRGIQESWRHPKPETPQSLPLMPKPEGEIAAISVQFLLKELELQLEIRDEALESDRNAREDVTRLTVEVAERDEQVAGLQARAAAILDLPDKIEGLEAQDDPPAQEPEGPPVPWDIHMQATARIKELEGYVGEQLKPPVPRTDQEARDKIYRSALDTIERRKVAVEEWEAKIERLQAEVERGEARRDVIRESAAASVERHNAETGSLRQHLGEKEYEITHLKEALQGWQDTERVNRREWEAAKERLNAKIVDLLAERHVLSGKLLMNEQDVTDMEEQATVNRIAALAMFQKLKAAAVMAKTATSQQVSRYLIDAVNFHLNGALEGVKWLNAEHEGEEQAKVDQRITD